MLTGNATSLDYFQLIKEARRIDAASCPSRLRVALLADCATQQIAALLRVLFFRAGVGIDVYEGPYGVTELQAVDPQSELYRFNPDVVCIFTATPPFTARYAASPDRAGVAPDAVADSVRLWQLLRRHSAALIVQSNWVLPYERLAGNREAMRPASLIDAVARANREIALAARDMPAVVINDIEYLAAYHGRKAWIDEKLWLVGRSLCALPFLPHVAQSVVDIVLAERGRVVKAVVLDLDNTLWGGEVGEDGVEGLRLGGLGDGEAYVAFQRFLLALHQRGILLAVCSKNDIANAVRPFREHPDMVLKEEHFAAFIANWDDKATNLRLIAQRLNVGTDALVFLDDTPFERDLVRVGCPGVVVPELPIDPARFVRTLSELNLFESGPVSSLDETRGDLYRAEARRTAAAESCADLGAYLRSLEMTATVSRIDRSTLPRVVQLLQRSNQFNLTTSRFNEQQCQAFADDHARYLPLSVALRDRFGDSGLVAVVIVALNGDEGEIVEWAMSCRVFGRGLEEHTMNVVVEQAVRRGCRRLVGRYQPTAKNALVRDLYGRLGFAEAGPEHEHSTRWLLELGSYQAAVVAIARGSAEQEETPA